MTLEGTLCVPRATEWLLPLLLETFSSSPTQPVEFMLRFLLSTSPMLQEKQPEWTAHLLPCSAPGASCPQAPDPDSWFSLCLAFPGAVYCCTPGGHLPVDPEKPVTLMATLSYPGACWPSTTLLQHLLANQLTLLGSSFFRGSPCQSGIGTQSLKAESRHLQWGGWEAIRLSVGWAFAQAGRARERNTTEAPFALTPPSMAFCLQSHSRNGLTKGLNREVAFAFYPFSPQF